MERNEAIERLRQLYIDANAENKAALECLIPKLKESEAERIRKELIEFLENEKVTTSDDFDKKVFGEWIAYLEKQKENKPELCDMGRWDEESYNNGIHHVLQNPEEYGLTKQKPAEWSEEDERLLTKLMTFVDIECFDRECNGQDVIAWLKSLRPQPHWKPSEEQMGALNYAYCELFKRQDVGHNILGPLQNLIDTLRKL